MAARPPRWESCLESAGSAAIVNARFFLWCRYGLRRNRHLQSRPSIHPIRFTLTLSTRQAARSTHQSSAASNPILAGGRRLFFSPLPVVGEAGGGGTAAPRLLEARPPPCPPRSRGGISCQNDAQSFDRT